ncbi:cancer-related nucleoside-triphosphatase homolog [Orussus abietinus]|uniref:cancer-related nucleoside-triphosphatase homolog n=1 Tax=Orussus abietinus TaxID=222816 RepID=UPI00062542EA|nr:cancer-related nucleoside-triphosphatase homolog [Orussus abietinus]
MRTKHVLLTGKPGIGKSTICKKVASMLNSKNYKVEGFYTEEVRRTGQGRVGFDVVPISDADNRSPLARVTHVLQPHQYTSHRIGNYNVFVDDFERVALPLLDSNSDVLVIDEIGKMEMFSMKFYEAVSNIFLKEDSKKICVLACIPITNNVSPRFLTLLRELRGHGACKLFEVSYENRDQLPQEIVELISEIVGDN